MRVTIASSIGSSKFLIWIESLLLPSRDWETCLQYYCHYSTRGCASAADECHPDADSYRRHHGERARVNHGQVRPGSGRDQLYADAEGNDKFMGRHREEHVPTDEYLSYRHSTLREERLNSKIYSVIIKLKFIDRQSNRLIKLSAY